MKYKNLFKNFSRELSKLALVGAVVVGSAFPSLALDYEGNKYIPGSIPGQHVLYGSGSGELDKVGFVSRGEVMRETPAGKEIIENKIQEGTAKYQNTVAKASEQAVRAIENYARENGYCGIFERGYVLRNSDAFSAVPESYEGLSLDRIVGMNDSTSSVLRGM